MHPGVLAAGFGALDVVIAGQAVYAVRRNDRGRPVRRSPGHRDQKPPR
jgi:hypothetical protein